MKANHDKCHLLWSSHEGDNIQIANVRNKSSTSNKLLGVTRMLDGSNCWQQIKVWQACWKHLLKRKQEIKCFCKTSKYMDLPKRHILMNAFFNANFNYCPTIWMFHSRSLKNRINELQERCLRMIYYDKHSKFEELPVKDNSVTVHHWNNQRFTIQMYMVANGMSPPERKHRLSSETYIAIYGTSNSQCL